MVVERRVRPEPLAVLRALGSESLVPASVGARVEQRLATTLLIEDGVSPFAAAPPAAAALPEGATALGKGALVALLRSNAGKGVALGLALALGAGAHAVFAKRDVRVVYVERPSPAPSPSPSVVFTPPLPPAPHETVPPEASSEPIIERAARALNRAESLKQERAQLDAVRKCLANGDASTALVRLAQYQRTFPRPKLAEERDALRVNALVVAGSYAEARRAIQEFRRAYPQSLLSPAVDGALSAIPSE